MNPIFIDFEASSLDLISSYPIEVGISLPDGEIHSWLIRPAPLWTDWSEQAQRVHGITRDLLVNEGTNAIEVAETLNELIPDTCYCDAWTHDSFWLHRLFRATRIKPRFELESVVQLLDDAEVVRWSGLRRQIIEETGLDTHRAGNDARILLQTWQRLRSE